MSVDTKCYDLVSDAGLEPMLVGGRGQASGFIMRMMAENKKKHSGQYKNPSSNTYGSTMKKFVPFDYNRLANSDQKGTNDSDYGASPFIIKHFGSPEPTRFVPKAQRSKEDVVEGETEEQKAARLNAKAEELTALAKELLDKSKAKEKVKGFLQGRVAIKKAKAILQKKKMDADSKDFEKKALEYAKKVRTEWGKVDRAISDYLAYEYKGSRLVKLRELMKTFFVRKMKERFPNFQKNYDSLPSPINFYGTDSKSRIIPNLQYDGPAKTGYVQKPLPREEAKAIYDSIFP